MPQHSQYFRMSSQFGLVVDNVGKAKNHLWEESGDSLCIIKEGLVILVILSVYSLVFIGLVEYIIRHGYLP